MNIIKINDDKWTKREGYSSKGKRVKSWFEQSDSKEVFLFKEPKNLDDGNITAEIWTELLAMHRTSLK